MKRDRHSLITPMLFHILHLSIHLQILIESTKILLVLKTKKNCLFLYIDSDTALGVTNKMIEHFNLYDQDVIEIADLIDTFIAELVPGWKPSFFKDETIDVNGYLVVERGCAILQYLEIIQ